jgi:hypothetical protein
MIGSVNDFDVRSNEKRVFSVRYEDNFSSSKLLREKKKEKKSRIFIS